MLRSFVGRYLAQGLTQRNRPAKKNRPPDATLSGLVRLGSIAKEAIMTMCGVVSNRLFAPSPALEEVTQPEDDTLTVDQLVLPKSQAAPIGDGGSAGGETFSGGDSVGCMNFFGDLGAAVGQLAGERWGEKRPGEHLRPGSG